MRSMTGFAERSFAGARLHVKISLKSLNHRFFDWSYKGSPLGEVENRLRSIARRKLRRGRVEASMEVIFLDSAGWRVTINEGLLEKILAAWEKATRLLTTAPSLSLDSLLSIPELVEVQRKKLSPEQATFLEQSFDQTVEELIKQRRREGRQTATQVKRHLRSIRKSLDRIARLSQSQPSFLREKILARLKDLNSRVVSASARLEEEVAFLAQRADIAEELLRLRSHVDAFEKLVEGEGDEPVGKQLDFLAQEIYREANTINSKSPDLAVIRESLAIKGEAESLRQHVQNLE